MSTTPVGIASVSLSSTKLPLYDHSPEGVYLRQFLLNSGLAVKANEVKRHQMLKDAIHALIRERFGEALDAMAEDAAHTLYERLCSCPDDELEADEPDGSLPLDLPGPTPD